MSSQVPEKYEDTLLKQAQRLILQENSFQFNGTAMGSKMLVAFANIFMAKVESNRYP